MFDKLIEVKRRYEEINQLLMDPTVINDNTRYRNLMKEYKNLTPLIEKFDQYTQAKENFEEAQMMLEEGGLEPDFKEMVQMQYDESKEQLEVYSQELKILLLPKNPDDDKNVIIEIRGGAGGEEASLFAAVLYRMYTMYAEKRGLHYEPININETDIAVVKQLGANVADDEMEKIAAHMGSAREVVTRMLRYFQNEGMVRLSRGAVEITDRKKLEELRDR